MNADNAEAWEATITVRLNKLPSDGFMGAAYDVDDFLSSADSGLLESVEVDDLRRVVDDE